MIDHYTISEKETHVGVMEYSNKPVIEIKLNEFYKSWNLKEALDRIKSSKGKGVATDEVLRKAANEVFSSENGGRPGASKALVILTDDKSTGKEPLKEAVIPLNDKGVRIYVVNIGPNTDEKEITDVVPSNKTVFNTITTTDVPPLAPELVKRITSDTNKRKLGNFSY